VKHFDGSDKGDARSPSLDARPNQRAAAARIGERGDEAADVLIQLSNCSLTLDDAAVLRDVSFELRRGQRWALVGPNGSGKTMLLKMLRGDVWPTPTGRERRLYCFDGESSGAPAGLKHHIAYIGPE